MTGIVLAHLRADDADTIEWVVKRRSAADETCRLLLTHSEPTVRGAAALGFRMPGMRHGPELPPEMRDAWAAAVTSVDISLRGMHKDYDVREVLEALVTSNPDVAEAWIQASLAKAKYSVGLCRTTQRSTSIAFRASTKIASSDLSQGTGTGRNCLRPCWARMLSGLLS